MLQCRFAGLVDRLVCDDFSGDQVEQPLVASSATCGVFAARPARGSEGANDQICGDRGSLQGRRSKSHPRAGDGYIPVRLGPYLVSTVFALVTGRR